MHREKISTLQYEKIYKLRRENNLSLRKIAKMFGVTHEAIRLILLGKTQSKYQEFMREKGWVNLTVDNSLDR